MPLFYLEEFVKNKIGLLGGMLVTVFLFCGCFDIYQNISQGKDNNIDIYTQITVSKMLLQAAAEISDEPDGSMDIDKFDDTLFDEILNVLPPVTVERKKINSSSDFGLCYKMSLDYKNSETKTLRNDKNAPFIPFIENGQINIKADFSGGNMLVKDRKTMLLLSIAKYRLTVDKKVCPVLSAVEVHSKTDTMNLTLTDAGNVYFVEIPIAFIYDEDAVIIIK